MGTSPLDSPALRTQLMATVAALTAERESLTSQIERIDEQLRAIGVLLGGDAAGAIPKPSEPPQPRRPATWPEFILFSLGLRNGGKTTKEIVADLPGSLLETKHANNPNALYNTLNRMERAKKIVRVSGRAYLPEIYEAIQRGDIEEDRPPQEDVEGSGIPSLIQRVLQSHPNGINARGVIRALRNIPEGKARLDRNPQVAYAALSRMVQNAIIVRDDRHLYRLPSYPAPEAAEDGPSLFNSVEEPAKLQ